MKKIQMALRLALTVCIVAAGGSFVLAKSGSSSSSSSSRSSYSSSSSSRSSSSSSYTSRSSASSLYNRSSDKKSVDSSGGYKKPSAARQSDPVTSSGGYSKPKARTETASAAPQSPSPRQPDRVQSSGGYSKPSQAKAGDSFEQQPAQRPQTAFDKGNRFDQDASRRIKMAKAEESRRAYEENQQKFKAPPRTASSNPEESKRAYSSSSVYTSTRVYSRPSYDDVHIHRTAYYRNSGWNPPVVIYQSSPYYGSWDSTFLWWMLWTDPSFGYHHYNDPYYQSWRNDALRLSEQNGDLKARLATQDAQIASLQQQGVVRNANYLPDAVKNDPVVALSDDAIATLPVQKPVLRVATGVDGGRYSQVGRALKNRAGNSFDVELIATSGAAENWQLLKEGKVDAALIQSDTAPSVPEDKFLEATVYAEYAMLIVSKDSPIRSVKDLDRNKTIYVGPQGSGTAITWQGFVSQDSAYRDVQVAKADYSDALANVAADRNSALLFVTGSRTPLLDHAGKTGQYRLVPIDDADFLKAKNASGKPVYDSLSITADAYPGLQTKELKTLSVEAVWTLSKAWIKRTGVASFDEVNYAVVGVISDLHAPNIEVKAPSRVIHWFLIGLVACVFIVFLWYMVTKVNVTGKRV